MIPCSGCGHHVNPRGACPVCGAARVVRSGAVAALLGLAACVTSAKDTDTTDDTATTDSTSIPQDLYGVTTISEPEYGISTSGGTGDTGGT